MVKNRLPPGFSSASGDLEPRLPLGDGPNPATEGGRILDSFDVLDRPGEDDLNEIFGLGGWKATLSTNRPDHLGVAINECIPCTNFATDDRGHQRGVLHPVE